MSELQNDNFNIDEGENYGDEPAAKEVTENPETGTELAPEPEATEQTQVTEVSEDEKKAKAQAAFNKQYGEKKQAERERDALQSQIEELKKAQVVVPQAVGKFPDEYDYDTAAEFETAKTNFTNSIAANERFNTQQEVYNNQLQAAQQAEQQKQAQVVTEKLERYTTKAKEFGITTEELQNAGNTVARYGISEDVTMAVLGHENGALITKYLAANPLEIESLNRMAPIEAAMHLISINDKAVDLKPKTSSTPNPTIDIEGGGGDPDRDSPLIKGATFE